MGNFRKTGVKLSDIEQQVADLGMAYILKPYKEGKLLQVFGPNEILEVEFKHDNRLYSYPDFG